MEGFEVRDLETLRKFTYQCGAVPNVMANDSLIAIQKQSNLDLSSAINSTFLDCDSLQTDLKDYVFKEQEILEINSFNGLE